MRKLFFQFHFTTCLLWMGVSIAALTIAPVARAGLALPYSPDANTLHLWHFDETNGSNCLDIATNINAPQIPLLLTPGQFNQPYGTPTQTALQGQLAAFPALGYSIMTTQYSCFLTPFLTTTASGTVTNLSSSATASTVAPIYTNLSYFVNTNTGAFTFETLIYPTVNPRTFGANMEILSGDSGLAVRAWQFRINSSGKLEYNNINGTGTHDVSVALPSTGVDAANSNQWYHVAITFTGNAPTNGDTAKILTMYWTAVDQTRTNCDVLATFTLGSGPAGSPALAVGGNMRGSPYNNVANSEGFYGFFDEARISAVCRKSNEMAFNSSIVYAAPTFSTQPPTNVLVGYGRTLTLGTAIAGSTPVNVTWTQNGVLLSGQTNSTLVISNVTFAANGNYQCFATNNTPTYGTVGTNSIVSSVTVGAAFDGLYSTGVDNNSNPLDVTAPGSVDLHYLLVESPDPITVNSNAIVWGDQSPVSPNGGYNGNGTSVWIGPRENGGSSFGTYEYQTQFLIDQGDLNSAVMTGSVYVGGQTGGTTLQVFVNGVETDVTLAPNPIVSAVGFTVTSTNGLQAGSNVVNFVSVATTVSPAFRLAISGIGQALPPGLPVITNQPSSQSLFYSNTASFTVVALARPPLTYQWYSNNVLITGATARTLSFITTNISKSQVTNGTYSANYQVVVSNASGSVTSAPAALTIQFPAQSVASAGEPLWIQTNQTTIVVVFSQPVDSASATNLANYSLNNGASIISATLGDNPNKVILTTSTLTVSTAYNLSINNVSTYFGVAMTSPASVSVGVYPSAALWLRADAGITTDANGVTQWNDQSTNGNNLSQTFGAAFEPQFVASAINGEPSVFFNATNETFMSTPDAPSLEITGDMSIVAVANFSNISGTTNGEIVSKTGPSSGQNKPNPYDYYVVNNGITLLRGNSTASSSVTSAKAPSTNSPHILDVVMQGTQVVHRLDGQTNGSGTLSTTITDGAQPLYIGTRADGVVRMTGGLSELMVFSSALSSNDVVSIENYLGTKYGILLINPTPPKLGISTINGLLTVSWPSDHIGWILQTQTNSIQSGLGTNWVNIAGSQTTNQFATPINTGTGSVFYRLLYP